jgi:hypothetical protein
MTGAGAAVVRVTLLALVLVSSAGLGPVPRFYVTVSTDVAPSDLATARDAIVDGLVQRGGVLAPPGESETDSVRRAAALGIPAFRVEWTSTNTGTSTRPRYRGDVRLLVLPGGRVVSQAELRLRTGMGTPAIRRSTLTLIDAFVEATRRPN